MSKNAPPPTTGYHPDWLPFIAVVELALPQFDAPIKAMDAAISALESWIADASKSWVPALIVVHGVRRLVTGTDTFRYCPPVKYDDYDDREILRSEWRDDTGIIELITVKQGCKHYEPVSLFFWRPKWEEFLGLRPTAAHEAKELPKRKSKKRRTKRAKQQTRKITQKRRMLRAALARLRETHQEYSNEFVGVDIAALTRQIERIWPNICKDAGVSLEDYPPPKWDMVAGEVEAETRRRQR